MYKKLEIEKEKQKMTGGVSLDEKPDIRYTVLTKNGGMMPMEASQLHISLDPSKRASDDIYEQLRELITSGALKPGDHLPSERAMMAQLQRSRPTIREALKRLEQGGYISSTQGAAGAVVQELPLHAAEEPLKDMIQLGRVSLAELNEYRQVNDAAIAAWAAKRRSEEDVMALRRCVAQAEASLYDFEQFVELDVLFHSLLARASGNRVAVIVTEVLGGVEKEALRQKMLTLPREERAQLGRRILHTHGIIIEAVEQRNSRAARVAMQAHTRAARKDLKP